MNFKATFSELTLISSSLSKQNLVIEYAGSNAIALHTKKEFWLADVSIDWYFKLIELKSNVISFEVSTSGPISRLGLKRTIGSKFGFRLRDDILIVDIRKLLSYKFRNIVVENLDISRTEIDVTFKYTN